MSTLSTGQAVRRWFAGLGLIGLFGLTVSQAGAAGNRPPAQAQKKGAGPSDHARVKPVSAAQRAAPKSPYCQGTYATDLVAVSNQARKLEETTRYTFCIRSSSVYQCAYYGPDGSLMSRRQTQTAHGTGFAFRRDGAHTYLISNEHLTEWPFVTSKESPVDEVPAGCKRVSQTVSIVDDENDSYGKDDITLQRVVVDPELDVAVLKAQTKLAVMPFGLGQSAALKVGDATRVRGFPLGAFQAVHAGKVITPREPDQEGKWQHWDFVVDAPLSSGNSGSPVLAVSCRSQEFELVGVYHAGYRRGEALNVVVGIDEFRELMTTLKPRRRRGAARKVLNAGDRKELLAELRASAVTPLLPLGGHVAGIRSVKSRLLYDIYPRKFPLVDWRVAVIEDLPSTGFGRIGRLWFGNEQGLRETGFSELKPGEQNLVANLVEAIRWQQWQVRQFRKLEPLARRSRVQNDKLHELERQMNRGSAERQANLRALLEMASQYAPGPNQPGLPVAVTAQPASGDGKAAGNAAAGSSGKSTPGGKTASGGDRPRPPRRSTGPSK